MFYVIFNLIIKFHANFFSSFTSKAKELNIWIFSLNLILRFVFPFCFASLSALTRRAFSCPMRHLGIFIGTAESLLFHNWFSFSGLSWNIFFSLLSFFKFFDDWKIFRNFLTLWESVSSQVKGKAEVFGDDSRETVFLGGGIGPERHTRWGHCTTRKSIHSRHELWRKKLRDGLHFQNDFNCK